MIRVKVDEKKIKAAIREKIREYRKAHEKGLFAAGVEIGFLALTVEPFMPIEHGDLVGSLLIWTTKTRQVRADAKATPSTAGVGPDSVFVGNLVEYAGYLHEGSHWISRFTGRPVSSIGPFWISSKVEKFPLLIEEAYKQGAGF